MNYDKTNKIANYLVKKYGANPDQDRVAETILGEMDEISSAFQKEKRATLGDFQIQINSLWEDVITNSGDKKLRDLIKNVEQTIGPSRCRI